MSFIEKRQEYGFDQLLSGTGHREMELEITADVERGDVVTKDGTKTTDGSDAFGIVLETVKVTGGKGKTTVVISGEVVAEFLKINGTVDDTFIKNMREKNIVVKKLGGR